MSARFTNKQVTTIVAGVCAAVVLAPAAVYAAASSVWIADPATGKRARVTSIGTLSVETRPGVVSHAFNVGRHRLGVGWVPLAQATLPNRVALTELTITAFGPVGTQRYRVETWLRKAGKTDSCNQPNLTNFEKLPIHRHIAVPNGSTVQQVFPGPPLLTGTGTAGRHACLGVVAFQAPNDSESYVAATGYTYVP